MNGIQRHVPVDSGVKRLVVETRLQPLFDLDQFSSKADLEEAFIGREWAFRSVVVYPSSWTSLPESQTTHFSGLKDVAASFFW